MRMQNGQKDFVHASARMAAPPMMWLTARKRSAAKLRSANWLLKNIPTIAATGKPLRIHVCSEAVKPRLGKYPKTNGYHAPQMNNSRTIMRKSLKRTALFIGVGQTLRKGEAKWQALLRSARVSWRSLICLAAVVLPRRATD